jgi:putative protease
MPKKTRKLKKTRKIMKRRTKVRKVRKVRKVMRRAGKAAKKVSAARKKLVKKIAAEVIGKVTHYYDRIGVAVVDVKSPIRLGDVIRFKRGNHEFKQKVSSMQINHQPIQVAQKGQEIGLKVDKVTSEGTVVLSA